MEEFKFRLDEIISWSGKSVQNFALSQGIAFSIMLLGYLLLFSIPGWVIKSTTESAQNAISVVEIAQNNLVERDRSESSWFETEYVEAIPDKFVELDSTIESAKALLSGNVAGANQRLENAKEAASLAEQAETILWEIEINLDDNQRLQETAFALFTSTVEDVDAASAAYGQVQSRYDNQNALYQPKYTTPLSEKLQTAASQNQKARNELALADSYLPPVGANDHTGDPFSAIHSLDQAKIEVDEINALMEQVTAGLDYQATTKLEAGPKAQQAVTALRDSENHVAAIQQATGYWLDDAENQLFTASTQLELAQATLNDSLDGYVDYPVAYEAAVASIAASASAKSSANTEVESARLAHTDLISLVNLAQSAQTVVDHAEVSQVTLDSKHANSTWVSIATNVTQANSLIASANNRVLTAREYLALDTQRFNDAYRQTQSAIGELNTAKNLAQDVINKTLSLESYRSEWPNAESRASSAISAERPRVNSYGSYSYSAKSDFDRAESLLSSARLNASSRKFEPAVSEANSAATVVYGTGSRAYGAYEDYQEEQERQRLAAEEAAERAAERAAEAARQASESSSFDYSSGGSSSNSWSSDSSSGGSYGGGSDSDYGGGSDSDYGSGSDSDW